MTDENESGPITITDDKGEHLVATDVIQKRDPLPNARADLILTEDGKIRVMDAEDPDGIDLLETIRDLIRRVEELEQGK